MNILLLFLLMAFPGTHAQVNTSCIWDEQDKASLAAIRNAMDTTLENSNSTECCAWKSMSCEVSHQGQIESLSILMFPGLFPGGHIPPQVCRFKSLLTLILSRYGEHIDWNDEIPQCLNELLELQELRIHGRPAAAFEVPAIPGMKMLDLKQVNLTEASFRWIFDSFKDLQELTIFSDTFVTNIPAAVCSLTGLVSLELSGHLTGEIPSCITLLNQLEQLSLPHSSLEGQIPYLGNFSKITAIDLSKNLLRGTFPASICNITATLIYVDLSGNQFTSPLPECMTAIPNLYASRNQLDGELPRTLFDRNTSKRIDLSWNHFTGQLPIGVATPAEVVLSNNFLSGTLSSQNWQTFCRDLSVLDLSNNSFSGSIPESIGNCTSLSQLNVHNNAFRGQIPSAIGSLPLNQFTARNNQLTGMIPSGIGNCSTLLDLDVANNSLSGEIGDWIYGLKLLYVLILSSNNFVGSIPDGFRIPHLLAIDLSENRFNGTLPAQLSFPVIPPAGLETTRSYLQTIHFYLTTRDMNLPIYSTVHFRKAYLDVSGNNLQGGIPESWGNLSPLGYLDLSRNQLVGMIPQSLGNLQELQVLDLSANRLSGQIPQGLANIPQLATLNVSHNNLSGAVPRGAQFNTFTAESYFGNPDLCGDPLSPCKNNKAAKPINNIAEDEQADRTHLIAVLAEISSAISVSLLLLLGYLRCSRRSSESDEEQLEKTIGIVEGELRNATQGFSEDNVVGRGGCSTIYRGVLKTGQIVAVKVFTSAEEQLIAEYSALRDLRHRNIVKMIDCCFESRIKALVFEFMPNGSLDRQLHELEGLNLPWKTRFGIVRGIADALTYLHEEAERKQSLIHRDVKPANVFLDRNMEAHLGDFGIAKNTMRSESTIDGESKIKCSIGYVAPEYGLEGRVSTTADVYSYGILVLETLTRIRPTSNVLKEISLRSLVESHLDQGRLSEVLDSTLRRDSSIEVATLARIGLQCSHPSASLRPRMREIAAILRSISPSSVDFRLAAKNPENFD